MRHLDERYPDLLNGGAGDDPNLERVVADLDRARRVSTATTVPPHHDAAIARALRERAAARGPQSAPARRPLRPRPFLVLAAALLGTGIAVFAHGVGAAPIPPPLIDQALASWDGPFQRITGHKMGQDVNLLQSACGWTMTVKRVYADGNQIVVGYTIEAPPGRTFVGGFDARPTATDAQGRTFPWKGGGGTETVGNEEGNVLALDASAVTDAPDALHLRLAAPTILTIERLGDAPPAANPCETYRPFKPDEVAKGWDYTKTRWVTVNTSFAFDLTIPFIAGRVADPHQAVAAGGTTITLERMVVTPSETRFYVRGVITKAGSPYVQSIAQLSVDGQTMNAGEWGPGPDGLTIYHFASLWDRHGDASLVITPRPDLAGPDDPKIAGGPWTFPFAIPQG